MEISTSTPIGQIVTGDYRTAAVLKKYGIDFCCHGSQTFGQACIQHNINPAKLKIDLQQALELSGHTTNADVTDYQTWPLDLLSDYIEKKHHRYVTEQIPVLQSFLDKLCKIHGEKHPELLQISVLFNACSSELTVHMKKEELILFPAIRKIVRAAKPAGKLLSIPAARLKNAIEMMMADHEKEGERFSTIKTLSAGYLPPHDGCKTLRVTYSLLKAFEDDLHLHIHLENNILFPRSIELEKQLEMYRHFEF